MALAAFTTGGTFSDRRGGSAAGAIKLSLVGVLDADGAVTATLRDDGAGAVVLRGWTDWLLSVPANSCRRTGSEPD
jgi:hypothetical protein